MAIKRLFYLLALFGAASLLQGCPGDVCVTKGYSFVIPADIFPEKDTIKVGDTLWLKAAFSHDLYDQIEQRIVRYPNGIFNFSSGMRELLKNPDPGYQVQSARPYFIEYAKEGDVASQLCSYRDGMYRLEIGFIAQKPGVYFLRNSIAPALQKGKKDCGSQAYTDTYLRNVNDNNLAYFLKEMEIDINMFDPYFMPNTFAFAVVE